MLTLTLEITIPIGSKQTWNHLIKCQQRAVEVMTISMMNAETQTLMLMATCWVIHTVILAIFILEMKAGAVTTTLTYSFLIRCAALAAVEKISQTTVRTVTMALTVEMAAMVVTVAMAEPDLVWMNC